MNQATVDFTLIGKSHIRIDVVDVLGRVVGDVAETTLDAGEYQFEIPAGLASGSVHVRLNVDGYTTTRKVIIY